MIIVGIGEILWDLLPGGKQLGGAPANFVYFAQALGATGYVVSAVGNDTLGHEILNRLQRLSLPHKYIHIDADHPTGTVYVKLDSEGVPEFTIAEHVAWNYIPSSPELTQLAAQTDAVCFGSLAQRSLVSQATIIRFLKSMTTKCLRVFDVNLRQNFYTKNIIKQLLPLTDVLKLNEKELPVIAELLSINGSETSILKQLVETYDLQLIALTKGKDGSRLFGANINSIERVLSVKVVDTVGAGDAFTAGLTVGLLRKLPLETIHCQAARLATFVCTQPGATPAIPLDLKNSLNKK